MSNKLPKIPARVLEKTVPVILKHLKHDPIHNLIRIARGEKFLATILSKEPVEGGLGLRDVPVEVEMTASLDLRAKIEMELLSYCHAKPRAPLVEVNQNGGGDIILCGFEDFKNDNG